MPSMEMYPGGGMMMGGEKRRLEEEGESQNDGEMKRGRYEVGWTRGSVGVYCFDVFQSRFSTFYISILPLT